MKVHKTLKILDKNVSLRKELEGGYAVMVNSLPGCITYGKTLKEAKQMAKEAIELYLSSFKN